MKKLTRATRKTVTMFGEEATTAKERRSGGWLSTDAVFAPIKSKFWGTKVDYRISVAVFDDAGCGQSTKVTIGRNYGLSYWDATNVISLEVPPALKDDAIEFCWKLVRDGKI